MNSRLSKWSLKYDHCQSCKTTLKPPKGKGLCSKCYNVYQEIEKMNNANIDELESYKFRYLSHEDRDLIKNMDIEAQKKKLKEVIEGNKLKYIRQYGLIETETIKVDVLKLEVLFNTISNKFPNKKDIYTNHLSVFNTEFNEKERKTIALLLLEMLI